MRVVVVVVAVVVVVVVVVGEGLLYFTLLQLLLFVLSPLSPTLIFLRGRIHRSLIRFLFGVGSVASRPNFFLGWDPLPPDQISLWGGILVFFYKIYFFFH